ncbi:MAG: CHAT domain-containing protein [Bdellovibrio bacteriovorus]
MARSYCELELRIDWLDQGRYYLSARFMDPESDQENQLLDPVEIRIDLEELRQHLLDVGGYGERLSAMLFGDGASPVRLAYEHARAAAASRDGLRIRLSIQASAPELHGLHWESLLDPRDGTRLITQEDVWFSRFASAQDFRLRPVPEAAPLSALIVVANPTDLASKWGLAPIVPSDEERIRSALSEGARQGGRPIRQRRLEKAATIYNIITSLREAHADILCLICHGTLTGEEDPRLLLEDEDGTAQLVRGRELVERLRDMSQRPRLVVLSSCEGAGDLQGRAMAAIGPRLAAAGVPSVIAMQGQISMESAARFLTRLFAELVRDGQIDRAVAVARSDIRDRGDWWMPVLFMRLKTGRLWPSAQVEGPGFDRWDALVSDIENDQCVPVLGPGLVESALGSRREMARAWAERYEFPLAPRDRDDLAQVAQYLAYRQSKNLAINELRRLLVVHMRNTYRGELQEIGARLGRDLLDQPINKGICNELILQIGEVQRRRDPHDVHRLLAQLPVRVFITANRDNLLGDALREAGRSPRVLLCNWILRNDAPVPIGPSLPDGWEPSIAEPLVFHVFGHLDYPQSLVLTEDDYFDFLIAVTRNEMLNKVSIPGAITNALASSGLLLLGFQADDWDFRVLFRGVLRQPGSPLGDMCTRVAVQMSPTEGQIIDPDRASKYLQSYFQNAGKIATFWGSAEAFMRTLHEQCAARGIL